MRQGSDSSAPLHNGVGRSTPCIPDRLTGFYSVVSAGCLDAVDKTAHDVVVGVLTGVIPAAVAGGITGQLQVAVLTGLGAFVVYFLAVVVLSILRYATGWHSCWQQTTACPDSFTIRFALRRRSNQGRGLKGVACEVIDPDGSLSCVSNPVKQTQSEVWFDYPANFTGGNAPKSGPYRITWFEMSGNHKWREILHRREEVSVLPPLVQ
jgi:hypothetical protein